MGMSANALYFAYGSNMSTARMQERVSGARAIGRARLLGMRLVFNKLSTIDGSAKANLAASPGDVVWGVLFEIDPAKWSALDKSEGGYDRIAMEVVDDTDHVVLAQTYVSAQLTDDPRPTEPYRRLIVESALEHGLPEDYVDALEVMDSRLDPMKGA